MNHSLSYMTIKIKTNINDCLALVTYFIGYWEMAINSLLVSKERMKWR